MFKSKRKVLFLCVIFYNLPMLQTFLDVSETNIHYITALSFILNISYVCTYIDPKSIKIVEKKINEFS